jgi:hypothetical protein
MIFNNVVEVITITTTFLLLEVLGYPPPHIIIT